MTTYRNGVAIGLLVVYAPSLLIAIYLAIRHGISRGSGWLYLIIFCLARIIGSAMQLAATPTSIPLNTGAAILNNVALSPLTLAALGFLSRLLSSISKTRRTIIHPRMIQALQIIVIVGLILGIVGGIDASNNLQTELDNNPREVPAYHPTTLNKAGTALFIVAWVIFVAFTAITFSSVQHAEPGEKRLFLSVALALPLLLIRLIYSCLSTFSTDSSFNLLHGSVTAILCMAFIEEFACVMVFEAIGLTLQKQSKQQQHVETGYVNHEGQATEMHARSGHTRGRSDEPMQPEKSTSHGAGTTVMNIAKKTIIGRIVMSMKN